MSLRPSRPGAAESELHRAIARLSVNDIERLGDYGGYHLGSSRQDEDARLARQMAIEEARSLETFRSDRALALSMHMDEGDGSVLDRITLAVLLMLTSILIYTVLRY